MKSWHDIYDRLPQVCHRMEFFLALAVLIGFAFAAWYSFITEGILLELLHGQIEFNEFMEVILNLVIGIEFMIMLCQPDYSNVLEILIFLVARHMIVGTTTPIENFLSVLAVCLLCVVRRFLRNYDTHEKERHIQNRI